MVANRKGLGAVGAAMAVSLAVLALSAGSRFYLAVKANEATLNDLRRRSEETQHNSAALADKILRGGVLRESNGQWSLAGTPPDATWSLGVENINQVSLPSMKFTFCDPQKLLSGAETRANCSTSVTASTTILGRTPQGKIDLKNYSLVKKATKELESSSGSRVSSILSCREYTGTALVEYLFRSILGRDPFVSELQTIMPCVASGNLLAWDLESNKVGLCGGKVKGLRAMSEYDHRKESVYAVFRSNVGRMPNATDAARIAGYVSRLSVPESSFITALLGVATSIRADYALGTKPYSSHIVDELYHIIYQGAYLPTAPGNTYMDALAQGQATLEMVVDWMRSASWYRSDNPYISADWAMHSEGTNFIYFALTGKHLNQSHLEWGFVYPHPFDVSNWWSFHAWVVDAMRTDPIQNGYQWMSQMLRYSNGTDFPTVRVKDAGICMGSAPRPQTVIWSNGNITPQGVTSTIMTPGWALVSKTTGSFVQYATSDKVNVTYNYRLGHTCVLKADPLAITYSCSAVLIPPTPGAPREFNRSAFSFGYLTQWQYDEADTFVDSGLANPPPQHSSGGPTSVNGFQSIAGALSTVRIGPGGANLNATSRVTGPGGSNQFTVSVPVAAQKESCSYHLGNRGWGYAHGPVVWTGERAAAAMVHIPAVAVKSAGGEYLYTDASTRILDIIWQGYETYPGSGIYDSQVIDRGVTPNVNLFGHGAFPSFANPGPANFAKYSYGNWGANCCSFPTPREPVTYVKAGISYQLRTLDTATTVGVRGTSDCYFSYTTVSPLVIDLGGQGVEYTDSNHPVSFDLDGNGKRGFFWIKGKRKTPFLVLDKDGDGKITSVHELFGNKTRGPDGKDSENGFLSLGKYDLNGDLLINNQDPVFSRLLLWFDDNENGVSEASELVSAEQNGIKSIDLAYLEQIELNDNYGNKSNQRSVVEMQDGSLRIIFDMWFSALGN